MEDEWLSKLDHNQAVIVPTRSLANELNERVARYFLSTGRSVWIAPTILIWPDYLRQLWQHNRNRLTEKIGVHSLISAQQSSLLWTQVIDASRRKEHELSLLNVQQTTRAVQRSWKQMHDWGITLAQLSQDHVADTDQFVSWSQRYQELLNSRGLLDESLLITTLLEMPEINHPFDELNLVSYDLLTAAQQSYFVKAEQSGIACNRLTTSQSKESVSYTSYNNSKEELLAALSHARKCVERDPEHLISIVIPDLARRQTELKELAREVFYPADSPLSVQQQATIYSVSLGQPLFDLPSINAAISVLSLLKNRTSTIEFGFLLRNRFLGLCSQHREQGRLFLQWLNRQRIHSFSFDQVPMLYQQSLDYFAQRDQVIDTNLLSLLENLAIQRQRLAQRLLIKKQTTNFSALRFSDWAEVFSDWLAAWHWRTAAQSAQLNSVQYQLETRWTALLEEFAGLEAVQKSVGMNRAFELLQQMARNTIFIPKTADSPIRISGVFEAIGRKVDTCIVTGMHQEYPVPPPNDAFISKRFLADAGHPQASADSGFMHAQSVMNNLLKSAKNRVLSYAVSDDQNREILLQPSALFRNVIWHDSPCDDLTGPLADLVLDRYQDTQGPKWSEPGRAKGGSKIFEDQSNCAFKAFATHQLRFLGDTEAEFGLDGLDRGNVVHQLLDLLWERLQFKTVLSGMSEVERIALINSIIDECFENNAFKLNQEKYRLLEHERSRLLNLLLNWLAEEDKRPTNFSVVEREEQREGELGGIRYRYIIDRLDLTEDGRSVIIDYKTGTVNRNDWTGERIKSPQMPLYALALDSIKNQAVSGIAFAQLKAADLKFIELSETDVFRKVTHHATKYQKDWLENRQAWPQIFEQLAKEFLAGAAQANPIDESSCAYCELGSLCRISQLRNSSDVASNPEADEARS